MSYIRLIPVWRNLESNALRMPRIDSASEVGYHSRDVWKNGRREPKVWRQARMWGLHNLHFSASVAQSLSLCQIDPIEDSHVAPTPFVRGLEDRRNPDGFDAEKKEEGPLWSFTISFLWRNPADPMNKCKSSERVSPSRFRRSFTPVTRAFPLLAKKIGARV